MRRSVAPRRHRALLWIPTALLATACTLATAQTSTVPATQPTPTGACDSVHLAPNQLYGRWALALWPEGGSAAQPSVRGVVQFERHPEYADSVRGRLIAEPGFGDRQLSGDATDGELVLDESEDGVAISAVWVAFVNPADCGKRLQGTRRPAEGRPASEVPLTFELRKEAGWQ